MLFRSPNKSVQHAKSQDRTAPQFEEVETTAAGHHVQTVRELQTVPVLITADMSKSRTSLPSLPSSLSR